MVLNIIICSNYITKRCDIIGLTSLKLGVENDTLCPSVPFKPFMPLVPLTGAVRNNNVTLKPPPPEPAPAVLGILTLNSWNADILIGVASWTTPYVVWLIGIVINSICAPFIVTWILEFDVTAFTEFAK